MDDTSEIEAYIIGKCPLFNRGHIMSFDPSASGADKTVYSCSCGAILIEHEDAGTGA